VAAAKQQIPDFKLEDAFEGPVCGIDEVGRGPLAGPVMAACVYIPPLHRKLAFWREVRDSKLLPAKKRDDLYARIKYYCPHGIGQAGPEEIDGLNIHHATLLAMRRAFEQMHSNSEIDPAYVLVDGRFTPQIDCPAQAVIKGDNVSLSIAAAAIIAKVTRDRLMAALHNDFPHYSWHSNAGYGTAAHLKAIRQYGITPQHRRSFAPCAAPAEAPAKISVADDP